MPIVTITFLTQQDVKLVELPSRLDNYMYDIAISNNKSLILPANFQALFYAELCVCSMAQRIDAWRGPPPLLCPPPEPRWQRGGTSWRNCGEGNRPDIPRPHHTMSHKSNRYIDTSTHRHMYIQASCEVVMS